MIPPLYKHQAADIQICLESPAVYNASDPGTGKTRTCIEVIRTLKEPTLVLAPRSILRASWEDDIRKFAPELKVSVAFADNRHEAFDTPADVYVTNLDAVKWICRNKALHKKFRNGLLIVDEATAFKHPTSSRSKALLTLRALFTRCIFLSGTPNPNGILDLWGQMRILDDGERLGQNYYSFRHTACVPEQNGKGSNMIRWVDRPGVEDAVYDLLSDIMIRHRLEDVIDMPENITRTIYTDLSPAHQAAYDRLRIDSMLQVEDQTVTAIGAGVLVQKLLQCLSGAVYDELGNPADVDSDRYDLVMDLVEQRKQCVVAFLWKHQRDALVAEAEKRHITYAVIDGDASDNQRHKIVQRFQAGELQVVFAHPQSAGHGLTLTKGTATIWASPTYNAEHFKQFNHRVYRSGQTQRTETILIAARGTQEELVYQKLHDKLDSMDTLLALIGEPT